MPVPQPGLEFIRDMALTPDIAVEYISLRGLNQAQHVLQKRGITGAQVCKFVVSPGPEAQLVVLTQQPGDRHPLAGMIFDAEAHTRPSSHNSAGEHGHVFSHIGRPIEAHDAVGIIAHLSQLAKA